MDKIIYKIKDEPNSLLRPYEGEADYERSIKYLQRVIDYYGKNNDTNIRDIFVEVLDAYQKLSVEERKRTFCDSFRGTVAFYTTPSYNLIFINDSDVEKYALVEDRENYKITGKEFYFEKKEKSFNIPLKPYQRGDIRRVILYLEEDIKDEQNEYNDTEIEYFNKRINTLKKISEDDLSDVVVFTYANSLFDNDMLEKGDFYHIGDERLLMYAPVEK